jgi:glycosyltransferase involved in cell wall biosynthesis
VLIVGDGSGRGKLEEIAGDRLGRTILLTGRIARGEVPDYLAAMDVGSLPQSVDGVGSFRYTIKLSEYLAAVLPVVTGHIPLAYDMEGRWLWRLAGNAPWDDRYIAALANLMERISPDEVNARRAAIPKESEVFDRARQVARVTAFIADLLAERAPNAQSSPQPAPETSPVALAH